MDVINFRNSEDVIERLIRCVRTRWFVLNNVHADESKEVPTSNKNVNWEPEKASGPIEQAIYRFEKVFKLQFGELRKNESSNLTMLQKTSLNSIKNKNRLQLLFEDKTQGQCQ